MCPAHQKTWSGKETSSKPEAKQRTVNLQSFRQERKEICSPQKRWVCNNQLCVQPSFLAPKLSDQKDPAPRGLLAQLSSVQLFCVHVKVAFGIHNLVLKLANDETHWSVTFSFKNLKAKENSVSESITLLYFNMTSFSSSLPCLPYYSAAPGIVNSGDWKHEVGESLHLFTPVANVCFHLSEHVASYAK